MLVNNLSSFNFIIVAFHEIGDSASSSIPVATLTVTEYWLYFVSSLSIGYKHNPGFSAL